MKRVVIAAVCLAAVGLLAAVLFIPGGRAQVTVNVDPAMSKGAAGARVTIVEFSDYQ